MAISKTAAGIYKMFWSLPEGGYFYYGQSTCLWNRRSQHLRHLNNGSHDNPILQRVFNKYGMPEFEIMAICQVMHLDHIEQRYLNRMMSWPGCCNISPTVKSTRGLKMSPESRHSISAARSGISLSPEHRKNISVGLRNAYQNGRPVPVLAGASNPFYGKKHTDATRAQMIGKSRGIGAANNRARLTLNLETGIFYDFCGEAAAAHNLNPQYLRRMLNGDRPNPTSFIYS